MFLFHDVLCYRFRLLCSFDIFTCISIIVGDRSRGVRVCNVFGRFWDFFVMLDVIVVKYVVFEALSGILVVFHHQFTRFCSVFVLSFVIFLVSVLIFVGFYTFS